MKIFALNLCLQFVHKNAIDENNKRLTTFPELMNDLFKGNVPEDQLFWVKGEVSEDFLNDVFELQKNEVWRNMDFTVCFVFDSEKQLSDFLETFRDRFSNVDAAGGLVINENEEYLIIFHRARWSLPKGGVEWLEDPQEAAIREVKEETGLSTVNVIDELPSSFHTFKKGKKWLLKRTYWFKMKADSSQPLVPQTEENITDVKWVDEKSWKLLLVDAFPQIRHIMNEVIYSRVTKSNT